MKKEPQAEPAKEEKKILLAYDEKAAQAFIDQARNQVEDFQAVIDLYHSFGFEGKITDIGSLSHLLSDPKTVVLNERLKPVPEEIAGLKIDRLAFLSHMTVPPSGLPELYDMVAGAPKLNPDLFLVSKAGQVSFNESAVVGIHEKHKTHASGKQAEVHELLLELKNSLAKHNELTDGYFEIPNLITHQRSTPTEKRHLGFYDKNFCLRVKP